MKIFVRMLDGKMIKLSVDETDTVEKIKEMIKNHEEGPVDKQRLIFAGRQLEDEKSLRDYGIKHECTLIMLLWLRGGKFPEDDKQGGMGDRNSRNSSMEHLAEFNNPPEGARSSSDEEDKSVDRRGQNNMCNIL